MVNFAYLCPLKSSNNRIIVYEWHKGITECIRLLILVIMESHKRGGPHPRLSGGRPPHSHAFSAAQMESLTAICEAIVPSIELQLHDSAPAHPMSAFKAEAEAFYRLSGVQNGVPEHVAGLIWRRLVPLGAILAWWTLWLLSTRLGTFILCGTAALSDGFPYLQTFSAIRLQEREKILLSWSKASGILRLLFRLAFKIFKSSCLLAFYSMVDSSGRNPSWKAIGYAVPDEDQDRPQNGGRPLEKGVIDVGSKDLASRLLEAGFVAAEGSSECRIGIGATKGRFGGGRCTEAECDVVVVGSGSGGGVAAGFLAQKGYRVLVLEKGRYYAREDLSLLEGPSLDEMYERGCMFSTIDGQVLLMVGATVGGGSAVNWSASIRTPKHVLEEWAESEGLRMFVGEEYQKAMDEVCARAGVVEGCDREGFQNSVLRRGCQRLGYDVQSVPRNSSREHFCGFCSFGCKSGNKKGTDETWLADAIAGGARILTGCKAALVVHSKDCGASRSSARGVLATVEDGPDCLFVRAHAVVVASGATGTPPLLKASGLRNPNIGRNLHLHPVRVAWGYFPEGGDGPDGRCYEGGIITSMCGEGAKLGYGTINQTPSFHPGAFAASMPWTSGADMKRTMERFGRTACVFTLVRDRGCGRVWRGDCISYNLDKSDRKNLADGVERALRILIAAGAHEVGTQHNDGERFRVQGASRKEIEDFLRRVRQKDSAKGIWSMLTSAHHMGSCRMGVDPATSCVDENGESWEVEGLFVSDSSVFPTALGVNPMITVQSIALCISRRVEQFLLRRSIMSPSASD